MKLTKTLLLFTFACLPAILVAQPTINNCENFTIGTVLKFQECNPTGVYAGSPGESQIWNFASLASIPDTSTEWMVTPSSTIYGSLFPTANLVEKYSNGTFVYVRATADSNFLVGYIDSINNDTLNYPNSILFALRPITFGSTGTDTFTAIYTSASYNFTGRGLSTINADGYGKLILPNGTYNNVLRIKITQAQNDTSSSGPGTTTTVSYVWFDSSYTSALLKIDSTQSGGFITRSVEYLLNEIPNGINELNARPYFKLYPNPSAGNVTFSTTGRGVLSITNQLGQVMETVLIKENETTISTGHFSPGLYFVTLESDGYKQTSKLIVQQ